MNPVFFSFQHSLFISVCFFGLFLSVLLGSTACASRYPFSAGPSAGSGFSHSRIFYISKFPEDISAPSYFNLQVYSDVCNVPESI